MVTFERATPLDHDCVKTTGALTKVLDSHHLVAKVGVATSGELGFGSKHRGVELGELAAEGLLGYIDLRLVAGERGQSSSQRRDLASGEEELERR